MLRQSATSSSSSSFTVPFSSFLLLLLAFVPLLVTPYPFRLPFSKPPHSTPGAPLPPLPPQHQQDSSLSQHTFQSPGQRTHNLPSHNDDSLRAGRGRGGSGVPPGQDRPDSVLTIRHILHHGGHKYPKLFRQLDLSQTDILLTELLTGESLTHRLKVKTTTTIKPHRSQDQNSTSASSAKTTTVWRGKQRNQGFRSMGLTEDQSFGPDSYRREVVDAPDVTDKETIVQLSKMNYNSYTEVASPGWYDLEGNWGVNSTFGWEEDGVRGHVFASADNTTLIIAIKGTTAAILGGGGSTATRDKINDNLLFSCCCAKVDRTWKGVCDCNTGGYRCDQTCIENSVNSDDVYYNTAMKILWAVQDMYPDSKVWLTGHSLGGGLSSLLGLTFGVPTVTFEMPGDRLAAQRLHLPAPPAVDWNDVPLFHVGHTADPIFQGVCNGPRSACYYSGFALETKCHTGRTCVYDPVGEDNWRVDVRTHRLFDTIEGVLKVKDVPTCTQEVGCVDCAMWEYL